VVTSQDSISLICGGDTLPELPPLLSSLTYLFIYFVRKTFLLFNEVQLTVVSFSMFSAVIHMLYFIPFL
jgi:hypothetical protein